MNYLIVLTSLVFFLSIRESFAQQIPKDTIYIEFKRNDGTLPSHLGKKFKDKRGLNFNLKNGAFLFPKEKTSDTLEIKHLERYTISSEEDIHKLSKKWWVKNSKAIRNIYGKTPPPFSRNARFVTFIVERLEDVFVLYPVYWRNESVVE
jgi:hypothetical protein